VADCSAVLLSYVAKLETSDALLLLPSQSHFSNSLNLGVIMEASKTSLVKEFGSMLCNPSDSSFLQLPEAGVQVIFVFLISRLPHLSSFFSPIKLPIRLKIRSLREA